MPRKLTAILSADVVGYSTRMESDEAGTLDRLKTNRARIFDPHVTIHGGRSYNFACMLSIQLLDNEGALAMLKPVLEKSGLSLINHAKVDPDLDPIRKDPRFVAMIAAAESRLRQ